MRKARIGFVCLSRKTFDYKTAFELYKERTACLQPDDGVEYFIYDQQVIEVEDALKAADYLYQNKVDAVVLVSATFHLGHLALVINEKLKKPILLWGFNELPYDGGKIRLNSVCGVNLNASNLYKGGYDNYIVHIDDTYDYDFTTAIKMKVALEGTNIGIIGYRAQGFFNVGVDEMDLYHKLGILINHYELKDFFMDRGTEEEVQKEIEYVKHTFVCKKLSEEQVEKVARLVVNATHFVQEKNVSALAIRCWPEFAATYGISPCAMMSILQSRGMIMACEGDVEAALSMVLVKAAGEKTPFMADLSQVNIQENYALLWHCGVAPVSLWDKKSECSLETYFAGGKGVTADFVLKEGKMSILRVDTARGKTRVFYEQGTAHYMEKLLSGTYAKVTFEHSISDILDRVTYSGLAHHVIMGYVTYQNALKYLARLMKWEFIDENYIK